MKCLVPFDLSNYKDLAKPGKRVVYDHGYAVIEFDPKYSDSLKINGMSVKHFLETFIEVYIISDI